MLYQQVVVLLIDVADDQPPHHHAAAISDLVNEMLREKQRSFDSTSDLIDYGFKVPGGATPRPDLDVNTYKEGLMFGRLAFWGA